MIFGLYAGQAKERGGGGVSGGGKRGGGGGKGRSAVHSSIDLYAPSPSSLLLSSLEVSDTKYEPPSSSS